jgi:hypothetical protein
MEETFPPDVMRWSSAVRHAYVLCGGERDASYYPGTVILIILLMPAYL